MVAPVSWCVVAVLGVLASRATAEGPREVLVVNTQDASVSRVDLAAKKETGRYPVGSRPYGIAVTKDGATVAVGVEDEEKVKFFDKDFKSKGETRIGPMYNDHIVLAPEAPVSRAMFVADKPDASSPSSPSSAGRKSPVESPRKYKTGRTSATFGERRM